MGGLGTGTNIPPQDLDLNTLELFTAFFSLDEVVTVLQLLGRTAQELAVLKVALLHELARQIAQQQPPTIHDAVKARVQQVANLLPPPSTSP
jgi:hypothetical protein